MIKQTIIKYKKLIIAVIVVLGIIIYAKSFLLTGNSIDISHKVNTVSGLSYIKDSGVVNKEMVVKSLNNVHQLVGLEGHTEKTYTYTDSIFEKSGWLKDHIGRRTIQYTVDAYFKTGIDLSSIKTEDVRVYGNSVFVSLPKTTLVSLDVPYDEIVFKTQTGLIRNPLSETEKQQLYTEIRKLVSGEIMSDKRIEGKTQIGVKDALDGLLEKIPNVNRVVFRFK